MGKAKRTRAKRKGREGGTKRSKARGLWWRISSSFVEARLTDLGRPPRAAWRRCRSGPPGTQGCRDSTGHADRGGQRCERSGGTGPLARERRRRCLGRKTLRRQSGESVRHLSSASFSTLSPS
eukprot:scaffold317_cov260-Pinguiococcus_pyrenoidosus.AAC.27